MTESKQAICRVCNTDFGADWKALAKHIVSKKDKLHRKGRIWASKVLMNTKYLDSKKDLNGRVPLTEQEKENKRDTKLEISGEEEFINAICPHCKVKYRAKVPIEYISLEHVWMINERYAIYCNDCRG
ncbi:hypothetical protein M0R04_08430 [Candidatus Dojkabacteria bacterium]|jgi:hypothetical protein|nr:hypothetical protein [Candidatus Dojkabacteria bacterium]